MTTPTRSAPRCALDRSMLLAAMFAAGCLQVGQAQQVQVVSAVPMSAAVAVDSIGVNTHMDYLDTAYGDSVKAIASLKYLGLKNVRDVAPGWYLASYNYLASEGFKFTFLTRSENINELQTTVLRTLEDFESRYPGSVATVEGLNEANFWPVNYKGQSGFPAAIAVQRDLYNMVKSSPKLKQARVANLTLGGVGYDTYSQLGDLSSLADVGNTHIYFNDNVPSASWKFGFDLGASATPSLKRMIVTETGYSTAINDSTGVDQRAQAIYTLYLLLNAWQTGVESVFLYQLVDHFGDASQSNRELGFGLFKNDWTQKDAAKALHNLTTTLTDGGATAAGGAALAYRISSASGGVQSVVLQEADGTRNLIVWREQSVWDVNANRSVPGTSMPVAIAFDSFGGTVTAVDLLSGAHTPVALSADRRIDLTLGAMPQLFELRAFKVPRSVDKLDVR